jgi:hypothetical protein
MRRREKAVRYLFVTLVGLFVAVPATASDVDSVEGLKAAVEGHEAALLSGDVDRIAETVMFPHVQFYPDGRVVVNGDVSDIPERDASARAWQAVGMTLVSHEGNQAIVRVTFKQTGPDAGTDLGAGLWCFTRVDGKWLINWRHYLGLGLGREPGGEADS